MFEKIIQLTGQKAGPTSIILAGVHGNEKCGIEALQNILPNLEIERGRVWFGYGNPRAIENNQRFAETNLNRIFKGDSLLSGDEKKSYEYERAQFLKKYLDQASALLDIHASFTPESKPFIICEANAKGIIENLPVDLIVSGFDQVEPGGTDYYMNSLGKIGICVECGYLNDPKSAKIAEKSIFAFLKTRGHLKNDATSRDQSYLRMYEKYYAKTDSFSLSQSFEDFETIEKDQLIGIDGKEEIRAKKQSLILFAHNRKRAGSEAFLLGEKKNSLV